MDWWGDDSKATRTLSKPWTGTTSFQLVQPVAKAIGHMHLSGRHEPVRVIESTKPEEIYPEIWMRMSKKQMDDAKAQWALQKPIRDACRKARKSVYPIPTNQLEHYYKTINDVKVKLKSSLSPAMPVVHLPTIAIAAGSNEQCREALTQESHREKLGDTVHQPEAYYALGHKQLSPKEWRQIPIAIEAVNDE